MVREYRAVKEMRRQLAPPPVQPEPEDEDATPLEEFLLDNPDATLWTAAQARVVLARIARMVVRLHRRGLT